MQTDSSSFLKNLNVKVEKKAANEIHTISSRDFQNGNYHKELCSISLVMARKWALLELVE